MHAILSTVCVLGLKKKLFDWRNPTDSIYPADSTLLIVQKKRIKKKRSFNIILHNYVHLLTDISRLVNQI